MNSRQNTYKDNTSPWKELTVYSTTFYFSILFYVDII